MFRNKNTYLHGQGKFFVFQYPDSDKYEGSRNNIKIN